MDIATLRQCFRIAVSAAKAPPDAMLNYQNFREYVRGRPCGEGMSERAIRETYRAWQYDEIKKELRPKIVAEVAANLLRGRERQISLCAAALVLLVILFPPFVLHSGGQTFRLGFSFIATQAVGQVDVVYLFAELAAVAMLYLFATRFFGSSKDANEPLRRPS